MDLSTLEKLELSAFPAPGQGYYARCRQKAEWLSPDEPPVRVWWIWDPRPINQLVPYTHTRDCVQCGPPWAPVLLGRGIRPRGSFWMPTGWPAGLYPLGSSREHFEGWRGVVLSALGDTPDQEYDYEPQIRWDYYDGETVADNWECGWSALCRATRLLAHHHKLISGDRLLAPYPLSRQEARREAEPLLDGLVRFSRPEALPGEHPPPRPEPVGSLPAAAPLGREHPVWDVTARVLRFRGLVCKEYRQRAPDQGLVLAVFEEEGWPEAIDDPLPGSNKHRKLDQTVDSLNNRLEHIKFYKNGNGRGIIWRPV